MNRAERRKAVQKGMTQEDLKNALKLEGLRAIDEAVTDYSAAVALTLRDKVGLSKPKTIKAMQAIEALFDSIIKGYVSIEDIKQTLHDDIGLVFRYSMEDSKK